MASGDGCQEEPAALPLQPQNGNSRRSSKSVDELEALFKRYCLLGQGHGSKKHTLNQTQMNKMFMDAGVYKEFPKLDRNVLGIYWSYAFKKEKEIDYKTTVEGWKSVFADRYNIDSKGEITKEDFWGRLSAKLNQCEGPKLQATKIESDKILDRLCDESKYTGMHKSIREQSTQSAKSATSIKPKTGASTAKPASAKPGVASSSTTHAVSRPAQASSKTSTSATRVVATSSGGR